MSNQRPTESPVSFFETPVAGRLRELRSFPDKEVSECAQDLEHIVRTKRPSLMLDEQSLCENLGIDTGRHLVYVRYYERSGRLSAHWEAHTRSIADVYQWWKLAPPHDVRKLRRISEWVRENEEKLGD